MENPQANVIMRNLKRFKSIDTRKEVNDIIMKSPEELYPIPYNNSFEIDKNGTIYILNENNEVNRIVKLLDLKFKYKSKTFYTYDLACLTFYGTEHPFDYTSFEKNNDTEIVSNGKIFKLMQFLPFKIGSWYAISNDGLIYSLHRNELRKHQIDEDGYHRVTFSQSTKLTNLAIHRLVYRAWVSEIPDELVVDHIDNNRWNNSVSNLQLLTPAENVQKSVLCGTKNQMFIWTEDKVRKSCELLQAGYTRDYIAKLFGAFPGENPALYKHIIEKLREFTKISDSSMWKYIVDKYDLDVNKLYPNRRSKYTDEQVKQMRKMFNSGISVRNIANEFGPDDYKYISEIIHGRKRIRASA